MRARRSRGAADAHPTALSITVRELCLYTCAVKPIRQNMCIYICGCSARSHISWPEADSAVLFHTQYCYITQRLLQQHIHCMRSFLQVIRLVLTTI